MECTKCDKRKHLLDEIYGLVDEARKGLVEGLDREYIHGIIVAIIFKLEREE